MARSSTDSIYTEMLAVDKSLIFQGESEDGTIIHRFDHTEHIGCGNKSKIIQVKAVRWHNEIIPADQDLICAAGVV